MKLQNILKDPATLKTLGGARTGKMALGRHGSGTGQGPRLYAVHPQAMTWQPSRKQSKILAKKGKNHG